MAYTGYVNKEVQAMYGIPLSQLTQKQRAILKADGKRRKKLIDNVQRDFMYNNKKAYQDEAKYEQALARLYRECQKKILGDVLETRAKVEADGGEWSYANQSALTRSKGLFEQINQEIVKLGGTEATQLKDYLTEIYTDQFYRTIFTLGQVQGLKGSFNMLNPRLVEDTLNYPWSGAMFSDRIWLDKERLGKNLRWGLTQSMVLGESIPEMTKRINDNINTAKYNAERVARTETKRVCYSSQAQAFAEQGVKEVKYMTAGNGTNSGVCKLCASYHGMIYELGKEPTLPIHPNCRCWYVPVVKDTFDDNELNELTNSVRGAENYENWRKAQEVKAVKSKSDELELKSNNKSDIITEHDQLKTVSSKPLTTDVVNPGAVLSQDEAYVKFETELERVRGTGAVSRVTREYFSNVGSPIHDVDFSNAEPLVAKKMAKQLVDLDKEWVSTLESFSIDHTLPDDLGGVCRPHTDRWMRTGVDSDLYSDIRINYNHYGTNELAKAYWKENIDFPVTVIVKEEYAIVEGMIHEYGHSILSGKACESLGTNKGVYKEIKAIKAKYNKELRKLNKKIDTETFKYAGQKDGLKKGIEATKELRAERDKIKISKYANESIGEFIAESFLDVKCGANPSPYSYEVYKVLEHHFKK